MRRPDGQDATLTAVEKSIGYLCFSCSGFMMPPTAAAEAAAEPDKEPNNMFAITFTCDSEPGKRPPKIMAKLIKREARPPRFIKLPATMKNGRASRPKLSNPLANFCETKMVTCSTGKSIKTVSSAAIPIAKAIGTPIISKTPNTPNNTTAGKKS